MEKTKLIIGFGLVVILALAIVGSIITGRVIRAEEEPIKIGIVIYPGHAPFFIAEEKGFFRNQRVNAEVVLINDINQAPALLESGEVQMLFSSADFSTILVDSGIKIKEILALDIGYGSDGMLAKDDVSSIEDLKGKTVYAAYGYPSHFMLRFIAKEAGLEAEDIEIVDMGADSVGAAFFVGQIDYGMSWEPWLSQALDREDGQLLFSSADYPGIITDTLVVRTDTLESREEDVKAVVRAWFDSIEFVESNPQEANKIMASSLGLPLEDFEAMSSTIKFLDYDENLERFDKESDLNIYELTEKAVEIFQEDGILQSEVNSEDLVDITVLRELYN